MKHTIADDIIAALRTVVNTLGVPQGACDDILLDLPTDSRFGDLSTNIALRLSKILKKPPRQIAEQISAALTSELEAGVTGKYLTCIKVEGSGFINFYFTESFFHEQLQCLLKEKELFFKQDFGKGKRVLLEFVSANPTGALSVAHARQGAVGDCLASIFSFLGFQVAREYYLNDEGNQITILGESVRLRLKELEGEKIEFPAHYYQGDYIYDIAKELKLKRESVKDVGEFAAAFILDIIKKELDDFGITFDCWYSQKALRESGKIDEVLRVLKEKQFVYEQDGAWWLKSSALGDDKDRVVVKSDGTYTYLAPDIAYHQEKYTRGFSSLINLWGPDHHGYINRLKAAVQALGFSADSLSIVIVQLASIFRNGKSIEMSTRRGEYITLREVLNEVGKDTSRFFFLMRRTSSHLDFDLETAKKETPENPVYYIQYAYARINSILENSTFSRSADVNLTLLTQEEEISLIKKSMQLSSILHICLVTQDPYMLTVYLQELAEAFHKFYDAHRVLGQEANLTNARLALIEAVRIVIATGLTLLGISRPEKM